MLPSRISNNRPYQLRKISQIPLGGAPDWHLYSIPCSLGLLLHIVSCTQGSVGSVRHVNVFFNGEGDSVEFWPSTIIELAIKQLSLVALSYQLSFNTSIRSYVVYGLTYFPGSRWNVIPPGTLTRHALTARQGLKPPLE